MKHQHYTPPPLAQKLLLRLLRSDLVEEVLGDLDEKFYATIKTKPLLVANIYYWHQALCYLRPFALKKSTRTINQLDMYQTYFKIGWRNLLHQKMYSLIKIGGFALGIAACLLILLFVQNEWSFDRHYPEADRIYRVVAVINENGDVKRELAFPAPMAEALEGDYPEVQMAGRYLSSELFGAGSNEVRLAEKEDSYYERGFVYFDQELLNLFQLPFVAGNPQQALQKPHTMVITQHIATKYFGSDSPLGRQLIVNNNKEEPYEITGVIKDFSPNSHIQFNFLISTTNLSFWKDEQKDWGASNYIVYLKLKQGVDGHAFQEKMSKGIIEKYYFPMVQASGMSMQETKKLFANAWLELQPLKDIYLHSNDIEGFEIKRGDIRLVWIFSGIALFVLLIAIVNFINLSTAKAANRAKEVGLRKVSGSLRQQIILQFLTESVLFSVLSFVLAFVLAWALLPYFNEISGKSLSISWSVWWLLPALTGAALLVGILAGLYPAFYLSSFQPIKVLKGQLAKGSKNSVLRSGLVVFQFTTSIVLIIGTLVIYQQMNFLLHKKIGFEKDHVLLIEGTSTLGHQVNVFKDELKSLPGIQHVSSSDYLPVKGTKRNGNSFWHEGKVQTERAIIAQKWLVDYDYINTLGIKLKEGRNFDKNIASDSASCIINQAMVRSLGGGNLIGKGISNGTRIFSVIGVVEDFHFENLRSSIGPICLALGSSPGIVSVKVSGGDIAKVLEAVGEVWKKFSPHQSFRFTFLDDRYNAMYDDVQRTGKILTNFTVLAIVVACLGLFALSSFMIEQRSKEIGIRLVLGASLGTVFRLLTYNFLMLVIISLIVATPIAWYFMQQWLQDFAYHIDLGADVFIVAGLASVGVAMLTIGYQSWKAGLVKPVESLRGE